MSSDVVVIRVAAAVRMVLAVSVAATGSFLPHLHGRSTAFFLLAELVWLPWVTAVFFASARPRNRLAVVGGLVGDLVALFGLQVLLPSAGVGALLGYLVVVAFGVYTAGRRAASQLAVASIALAVLGQFVVPTSQRISAAVLIPFSVAVLALVLMIERTATRHFETEALAARLRTKADTILANVADAVVVMDGHGVLVEANAATETLVGRPVDELVGHPCAEILGLHRGERAFDCSNGCALVSLLEGDDASQGLELWRPLPDDRRQPLLASAIEIGGQAGTDEVVHSLRDITRIKQAEEAKTLFLATASHELKTPLTVIQGFADTLARYPDLEPKTKAAALEAIRARSVDLARIVDRLLVSSRIEAGRVNVVSTELDVAPLVFERVQSVAAATGRDVRYLGPEQQLLAWANADSLVTVVDHLLDNALKYSPGGEPVTVTAGLDDEELRLSVEDRGVGMDREQARHCFDKFWQGETTDVRRFGGTGIGLYIVQSLVEAMGGSVEVTSERDVGSTFTIRLRRTSPRRTEAVTGEPTSIQEFMKQLGVVNRGRA